MMALGTKKWAGQIIFSIVMLILPFAPGCSSSDDDETPAVSEPAGNIPAGYKTGQWPVYPDGELEPFYQTFKLLDGEPEVTMTGEWTAKLSFTTSIPAPAVTVYYGLYDSDSRLPRQRFRETVSEELEGESTEHSVELEIEHLTSAKLDIAGLAEKGGGVVAYRIEIYNSGIRGETVPSTCFFDRRFEFYNGKRVPTVSEGPFVDQITETGAIISWETDMPVSGLVTVEGIGKFPASGTKATHFEVPLTGLAPGISYSYSVEITDGTDTTAGRTYFFHTPARNTDNFAFAVLGDSRAGESGGETDYNGVNASALKELSTGALKKGAEFIVNTGDLVTGYSSDPTDFQMQLQSYKTAVENVGHYIPMYEMMGNHEVVANYYLVEEESLMAANPYGPLLLFDQEGENSAEAVFAKAFVNPLNGPDADSRAAGAPAGKSVPTYKENVYYFDYGNCRFVMMNNNYWLGSVAEKYGANLEGYILDDQKKWLLDLFGQTKTDASVDHLFIFAQEPLFPVGWQSNTGMWYKGGDPEKNGGFDRTYVSVRRDEIWKAFLDTGKAVAGNFGDEHNYSRTFITKDREGKDYSHPAWQIIAGGGGAPFAALEPGLPWSDNVEKHTAQIHYTLLRVNGQEVRLEVYNVSNILIESVILKSADGTIAQNAREVEPVESASVFASDMLDELHLLSGGYNLTDDSSPGIPEGYRTGLWPEEPESVDPIPWTTCLLLDGEPQVTMTDEWTARIDFTTVTPTRAATVYYGVYDPDATLPLPRFRGAASEEDLEGENTEHSVTINLAALAKAKVDITGMAEKGGGTVAYRLSLYGPEYKAVRFYDRRFEFYKGKLVPTVKEGPFVDQTTDSSAVISWETDMPVSGTVKVEEAGDFRTSGTPATHFEVKLTGLAPNRTYNYSVEISDGSNTTATRTYFFRTHARDATPFAFAVMGDSRGGGAGGEADYNGVNAPSLRNIVTDAFNRGADFIVNTGDLATGYTTPDDFRMQMKSYKAVVESVGHYIPMYEMMGNHESVVTVYLLDDENVASIPPYGGRLMLPQEGKNAAEVLFAEAFVNPANGPEVDIAAASPPEGKSPPPYKESAYYFDYGNCRFVMLNNNYWYCSIPELYGANLEGYIPDDEMKWLLDVFEQTKADKSVEHLFLYAQEPFFPVAWQTNTGMWYQGGDPDRNGGLDRTYVAERRDQIWRSFLATGKARLANFGDEHTYSRALISKDRFGNDFDYPIWQVITGGGGAPYVTLERGLPWSDGTAKHTAQMSYIVIHVDGSRVNLDTYSVDGVLIDTADLSGERKVSEDTRPALAFTRMKAKPGKEETLRQELISISVESRKENGCVSYIPLESLSDPGIFAIYDVWKNRDTMLAHVDSSHIGNFVAGMADFLDPPEGISGLLDGMDCASYTQNSSDISWPATVLNTVSAKSGKSEEARGAVLSLSARAGEEAPGCLRYDIYQGIDMPGIFIEDQTWESYTDLSDYSDSTIFNDFLKSSSDMFESVGRDTVTVCNPD